MTYKIATRGSKLALAQAQQVADALAGAYPEHTFELCIIKTQGDLNQHAPLHQIGGKGVFVREIEQALLNGSADLAVHSMKDMPCEVTPGLSFSRVWKREDPRDVLVLNGAGSLRELPHGAQIACAVPISCGRCAGIWKCAAFAAILIRACAKCAKHRSTGWCWRRRGSTAFRPNAAPCSRFLHKK